MNTFYTNDIIVQAALRSLATVLSGKVHCLTWWKIYIFPLKNTLRSTILREMSSILARNMRGVSRFAVRLKVDKITNSTEFESFLFDFLMPWHEELINLNEWDEALNLEMLIYANFIKQDEDYDFYERAFSSLYAKYSNKNIISSDFNNNIGKYDTTPSNQSTLFWFQNYSTLAHTQLVLDLCENLPTSNKFYVSALSNANLQQSSNVFTQVGIKILTIDDTKNISLRCNELIELCKLHNISNIVCVSIPLQSGYLKLISDEIKLTWWSMKYPLGCMRHFDRLVCNRTLFPNQKIFNGALWQCAPFALKALSPYSDYLNKNDEFLKLGVLAREEKFSSSNLPEILNICILENPKTQLFWTGRKKDKQLNQRLNGTNPSDVCNRINFSGWVNPGLFLSQIDLLIDTPNLGGMAAYWAMSMGKVVVSATDSGSVGALGSRHDLLNYFELLSTTDEINNYFSKSNIKPYYLSNTELIPICISKYIIKRDLLEEHGRRFLLFFNAVLSNMSYCSEITYKMLQGSYQNDKSNTHTI
jgi:hypothetical protein